MHAGPIPMLHYSARQRTTSLTHTPKPTGRDTAACIGLAARIVAQIDPAATVVAMPSDHVVADGSAFREHLAAAEQVLAEHSGALLVFGVEPDRPATGYGYLRAT